MEKQTIIYCYRMTHDYGINPCVFTEDYEPTPHLLTEGGCMSSIRRWIYSKYASKLRKDDVDVYLLAIAGHPNDGGKRKDEQGFFIHPTKYQHLMFVAKISDVISKKEYLEDERSKGRRDTLAYSHSVSGSTEDCGNPVHSTCGVIGGCENTPTRPVCGTTRDCRDETDDNEKVLLSHKFSYYGGEPREIPEEIFKFFPKGRAPKKWDTEKDKDIAPFITFIKCILSGENHINQPYHPMKA